MIVMKKILHGDCLEVIKTFEDDSIDAIVTDPPYGLSFMGNKWDCDVPSVEIWTECLRVLKPGGYLLAFAGTRTQHRMAVRIEDAGFEIRDMIAWVYGSGFPKSLNIGKAVDKLQGNEREVIVSNRHTTFTGGTGNSFTTGMNGVDLETGKTLTSKGTSEWEGWGTALKPALEPITVAKKPLSEKTVAENCLKWGTGGINIDECRVDFVSEVDKKDACSERPNFKNHKNNTELFSDFSKNRGPTCGSHLGRFPANFIHDGSDEVVSLFPNTNSGKAGVRTSDGFNASVYCKGIGIKKCQPNGEFGDSGSEARYFYCAKAGNSERNENNNHPTVKPIALMEYLVKLVSREGAVVLDPFAGSGSTGVACHRLGRDYILIERESDYIEIIEARLKKERNLFDE